MKIKLISRSNIILGEEKRTSRIIDIVSLFIIFIALTEVSLVRIFNVLHLSNNEIMIFNSIINIQLIATTLFMFISIINTFYLASDWKQMMVYPIKSGNLLLSKCVLCYFSSMLISIFALIFLFSYGILANEDIIYYLQLILYEIIITAVPTVYIVLTSLTVLWIISVIKSSESKDKKNKWLIVVDLVVIILTCILFKFTLNNHIKVSTLLFNIFFSGNQRSEIFVKFILALFIIVIGCIGFYLVGGNVYLTIMKSGAFRSKDSKKIELHLTGYDFKLRNPIVSNIIRDVKLIMRIPVLRTNCIMGNAVISAISVIILILFRKQVVGFANAMGAGGKSFLLVLWLLSFELLNFTAATSFSREGRALNQFKVYPVGNKKILFSKICVGILTNIFTFISTNVLIVLISLGFVQFILFEAVIIVYMIGITIIQIERDINSIELKWIDIKDLFQIGVIFKVVKPYFILTMLPIIYAILFYRLFHIELTEFLNSVFLILMVCIYSIYSFKKIINNMG
ncbi:hypothetical protein CUB90_15450 [Clostridium sp. CT7]|nr:hypothetical protein CUB90_15450 [Clostridium sp. CT7]